MIRRNVQVYIYNLNNQKILMLKRIPEKAGYWQPVCGGIEKGENAFEAARRELEEETGIRRVQTWVELPYKFKYDEPKDGVPMQMEDVCYIAKVNEETDVVLSNEHESYKWINPSEVMTLTDWEPILTVCDYIMKKESKND